MESNKGIILGTIFGILGIILSAVIFIAIVYYSGYIIGYVAILCGAIAGGGFGLGYKLGKGTVNDDNYKIFLTVTIVFGVLGVLAAYIAPYILFISKGISFFEYISLMGFGFMDILFIAIGAYGGEISGRYMLRFF